MVAFCCFVFVERGKASTTYVRLFTLRNRFRFNCDGTCLFNHLTYQIRDFERTAENRLFAFFRNGDNAVSHWWALCHEQLLKLPGANFLKEEGR